ncbi:MAG: DUF1566 domain-containing protein [Patescibacteria group bacterium]|nr:DUF1566 domain-containing protein [Patescibacteria group bacterium]
MYKLTKLDGAGDPLPDDAAGHLAVKLERDILAHPIVWAAQRSTEHLTWEEAKKWAGSLTINGWNWRLPTAEEAFLLCDRSRTEYPVVDPKFFPDCDGEWIWTSTEDLVPPAGCAWLVGLDDGYSGRLDQVNHSRVRAVRAGQ